MAKLAKQNLVQNKQIQIFKKVSEQERTLKELVSKVKQEGVVERLIKSDDKVQTFESFQREYKTSLRRLKEGAIRKGYRICSEIATEENAVEIGTICLMAGIEECELFQNYSQLQYALQSVRGNEERTAMKIYRHFALGKIMTQKSLNDLVLRIY